MTVKVRRVTYFHVTVRDRPGEAYRLLAQLAASGVDLVAFNAVPIGPETTRLTLFPDDEQLLVRAAEEAGLSLDGPEHALLCRGDDQIGALAEIHRRLADAHINVFASSGVTSDCGGFGYLVYVRASDFDQAAWVFES